MLLGVSNRKSPIGNSLDEYSYAVLLSKSGEIEETVYWIQKAAYQGLAPAKHEASETSQHKGYREEENYYSDQEFLPKAQQNYTVDIMDEAFYKNLENVNDI